MKKYIAPLLALALFAAIGYGILRLSRAYGQGKTGGEVTAAYVAPVADSSPDFAFLLILPPPFTPQGNTHRRRRLRTRSLP